MSGASGVGWRLRSGGVVALIGLLAVAASPPSASAQSSEDRSDLRLQVVEGERVRLTTSSGREVVGEMLSIDDRLIVVESGDGLRLEVPAESVDRVEVSLGKRRRFVPVFAATVGFSALVGGLVESGRTPFLNEPGAAFEDGIWDGVKYGIPIGVALGLLSFEEWEDATLGGSGPAARISVSPTGGLDLRLSLGVGR